MKKNFLARANNLVKNNPRKIAAASMISVSLFSAGAQAGLSSLDASYTGYYNNSGFFTEIATSNDENEYIPIGTTPEGSTVGGEVLGDGFKLYGSSTMSDSELGQIGNDPYANSGNVATGLGFVWIGSLQNAPQEGDKLVFDYEFDISFTDNNNTGSSVYWEIHAGIFPAYDDDAQSFAEPFSSIQSYSYSADGGVETAGTTRIEGTAESDEVYLEEGAEYFWGVWLVTEWYDSDDYQAQKSGDTFTVTVPTNSIDVGLNAAPGGTTTVPAPFGVGLLGFGALMFGARLRGQARK